MPPKGLLVPVATVGKEEWFLLSHYGQKHLVRFLSGKSRDVSEPSGHRVREMTLEGDVKWRPKDPSKIDLRELPPIKPR